MKDIKELRQSLGAMQPEEVAEILDRLEAAESVLEAFGTTAQEVECWLERYRRLEREAEAMRTRLETAEKAKDDWLYANAPGGWIDALRLKNDDLVFEIQECEAERKRIEKERDTANVTMAGMALEGERLHNEIAELRTRIKTMEKQEPVAWMDRNGTLYNTVSHVRASDKPLYLAPGAKGE